MPFSEVTKPAHAAEAFGRTDDAAILSQAAILLTLGGQLRGQLPGAHPFLLPSSVAVTGEDDDWAALGIPHLFPTADRVNSRAVQMNLETRYKVSFVAPATAAGTPSTILADLAGRLLRAPEDTAAAELMEGCLGHPHELVRVAAASAHFERSSEPGRLLNVLRQGTHSAEPIVRDVAAASLARISPDDDTLRTLGASGPPKPGVARPSHTTALVHGTWATNSPWWQPGGDFFNYLTNILPPLQRTPPLPPLPPWDAPYGAKDFFFWSGGYSDAARSLAAQDLQQWVESHKAMGLDLITHSHGGNVAFLATQLGVQAKEVVLLSCPVHFPKYMPNFDNVQKLVSIRVHFDLVILADLGGQRFQDPRIQENVLPVWFDHFATHDPNVWAKYNVPAML